MAVKTFKVLKKAIWMTCIIWDDKLGKEIAQPEQNVDLKKLKIMLEEIKYLLESHDNGMTRGLNEKAILKRLSLTINARIESMVRSKL